MAASSTFPLLGLPQELRTQIYTELLCPTAGQRLILYCAPEGRPPTLDIYPAILRCNKQIYYEALPLLYSNAYTIDLTTLGSSRLANLFLLQSAGNHDSTYDMRGLIGKGYIYPYVFQRFQHIEVVATDYALWPWGMQVHYRAQPELLLNEITRCLSESSGEIGLSRLKTFGFDMVVNRRVNGKHVVDGGEEWDVGETKTLLRAVRKMRKVRMKARLRRMSGKPREEVDLDDWVSAEVS